MTQDELNEIKARVEVATPGPWEKIESHKGKKEPMYGIYTWDKKAITGWNRVCQPGNDAAFIAHARADIPALLAHIEALHLQGHINWKDFAYLLAAALADEVHYSQTPSEDTLALLDQARDWFADTDLIQRLDELKINELEPVE